MGKKHFTAQEHLRIEAAIQSIEQSTTADLDVMVIRASDRYSLYPLVWAAAGALIIGGLASLWRPDLSGRTAILVQLMMLIALIPLFDWLPIRLSLVPKRVKHANARRLAHREFVAPFTRAGSNQTRILFFVSLGEHYVEIIADRDTHALMPNDAWNEVLAGFTAAVRGGRVADGLLEAIKSCGALLNTHYPA